MRLLALVLLTALPATCSAALAAGSPAKAVIAFEQPVYANMPVWVHVTLPKTTEELRLAQVNLRYPFSTQPWEFHGHTFQVTRDGVPLPMRIDPRRMGGRDGVGSVGPPTAPAGRLPLHVLYRFDQPGKYLVRYQYTGLGPPAQSRPVRAESEWTELDVHPFFAEQRATWLKGQLAHPPKDLGLFIGDYLPSLLATPDDRVLAALLAYLHRPDELVQRMAIDGLSYYPDATIRGAIPKTIREQGPTVNLAYFIAAGHDLRPAGDQIVTATLPYLTSKAPSPVAGALQTLVFMENPQWGLDAHTKARINAAIWKRMSHPMGFQEHAVLSPLTTFLVFDRSPRARALLWKLSSRPSIREQALINLAWFGDGRDLAKLGALLKTGDPAVWPLAYQLRRQWGEKATPYLVEGLRSANARTRYQCARELAQAGHREGFAYLRQVLERGDQQSKMQVIMDLTDRFGLPRGAAESQALALLDAKLKELQ